MGKIRNHKKDLTLLSGTKERMKKPLEHQSTILGVSSQNQSEGLKRRIFSRIREAQEKEREVKDFETEKRMLPIRIRGLAQRLENKDYHKWTSKEFAQAQELLGERVIRVIITNQEKKREG